MFADKTPKGKECFNEGFRMGGESYVVVHRTKRRNIKETATQRNKKRTRKKHKKKVVANENVSEKKEYSRFPAL